jgi:hypothetical protein
MVAEGVNPSSEIGPSVNSHPSRRKSCGAVQTFRLRPYGFFASQATLFQPLLTPVLPQ